MCAFLIIDFHLRQIRDVSHYTKPSGQLWRERLLRVMMTHRIIQFKRFDCLVIIGKGALHYSDH